MATQRVASEAESSRFFGVAQRTDEEYDNTQEDYGEAKDAEVKSPTELPEYAEGQTGVEVTATPEPVWGPYAREHRFADNKIAYTFEEFSVWFGNKAQEQWDRAEIAPFNVFRKPDKPDRK